MAKKIKKTDKAIIWGRVSTTQQEVETQVAELVTMALADGYRRENLIILKSVGASAIKQNERYKREVNNLISTMDNDSSVKCVYVWEISRIARVELTFYKMKDYFVKNKVQLIVKTPEMHLLNDDGEVDPAQEIVMSVMITLAKQEMEITKKRMKRGKERSQTHGKFGGGHLVYGYCIDDDTRNQIIDRVVDHADVTHIDRWTRELVVHNKLGLPPIVTGTFRISTRAGKTKLSWFITGMWFNDSTWLEKRFKHS